jgi:hypothetical protein
MRKIGGRAGVTAQSLGSTSDVEVIIDQHEFLVLVA